MKIQLKPYRPAAGAARPLSAPGIGGAAPQALPRVRLVRQLPIRKERLSGVPLNAQRLGAQYAGEAVAADGQASLYADLSAQAGRQASAFNYQNSRGQDSAEQVEAEEPVPTPREQVEQARAASEALTWESYIANTLHAAGRLAINTPVDAIRHVSTAVKTLEQQVEKAEMVPHTRALVRGALARLVPEALFAGTQRAEVARISKTVDDALNSVITTYEQRGLGPARSVIDRQIRTGVFSEEEAREQHHLLEEKWEIQEREAWMHSAPDQVLAALEDPTKDERSLLQSLDDVDRPHLQERARSRHAEQHADEALRLAGLADRAQSSWTNGRFEEELDASPLTKASKDQLRHLWRTGQPQSWGMLAHVRGLMERYDPGSDLSGVQYHRLVEDIAMLSPAGMREWMMKHLDQSRAPLNLDDVLRNTTRTETIALVENYLSNQPLSSEAESRALLVAEMELDQLLSQMDSDALPESKQLFKHMMGQDPHATPEYPNRQGVTPMGRIYRPGRLERLKPIDINQQLRPAHINFFHWAKQ